MSEIVIVTLIIVTGFVLTVGAIVAGFVFGFQRLLNHLKDLELQLKSQTPSDYEFYKDIEKDNTVDAKVVQTPIATPKEEAVDFDEAVRNNKLNPDIILDAKTGEGSEPVRVSDDDVLNM